MKKIALILSLAVLTLTTQTMNIANAQDDKEAPKPLHAPPALPGVEQEMLNADYWISLQNDPDEIVMTADEIEEFNARVRTEPVVFKDRFGKKDPLIQNYLSKLGIGLYMHPVQPLDLPDTLPGDSLRVWLKDNIDYLQSRDFYDSRNATYNESMKQDIVDAIDRESVPNVIRRRWGLIVRRADVRLFPTSAAGFSETKWEMDMFQTTGVYIITPCAILHESRDGDFYYVQTDIARGWIAADRIALDDKKTIRKLTESEFLLAAGDKIPVYGDKNFENFVMYYYMSATLPLWKKTRDAWVVKLPYRKIDGSLGVTDGYIRPDADVHVGFLPFTKRNALEQSFKLLHNPYGWADQFNKRDCSGNQRVVLRSFGIVTGRWPNFVLLASRHRTYIDPSLDIEDKIAEIAKIEPAITWCGTGGHLVYYLGKARNGKVYFMHEGGWGYDEGDQHYFVNRVALNEAHHKWYDANSPRVFTTFRK